MNFNIKEINEEFNKTKLDIPKINNTKDSEQIKEQKINDEKEKELIGCGLWNLIQNIYQI